jgi:hypothetical protein
VQQPPAQLVQRDRPAWQPVQRPPIERQRLGPGDQQPKRLLKHLERRIEFVAHAAAPSQIEDRSRKKSRPTHQNPIDPKPRLT